MSDHLSAIYNHLLDASAAVHFPVKIFVVATILLNTPANIRYLSWLLLNGMMWNFAANTIFTFLHVYPLYPAQCYRADGVAGLVDNETFRHVLFLLLFLCILNCVIAITKTFFYRYIIFTFPNLMHTSIQKVVFLCFVHTTASILTIILYIRWIVQSSDYPYKDELLEQRLALCFKPDGLEKFEALLACLVFIILAILSGCTCTVLLLFNIQRKRGVLQKQLLDRHRNNLFTLITITTVPVVFGAFPLVVILVTGLKPHLAHASEIFMLLAMIMANHGTLYALIILVVIRPYRRAAKRILGRIFRPMIRVGFLS
ncbi:hypothetical protein QR680_016266 [Steinernema hermaphroditum]|uniref:Uncharacterized protein n=1 Tax=Steinernema hermaphroditum TaxID=289476 RepID=A0AA39HCL1_9BILA|nr:hypothetical protein QR680_016266 [Steinernema hermaphroditum]